MVVVLQGVDLKLQFIYLFVVINLLCFDLNLHLLHLLLCARIVVVSQCSASSSHIMTVYNFKLFPFSGPLYSHNVIFNFWFIVL